MSAIAKIKNILSNISNADVLVTIGNPLRKDDGVGPYIAAKIKNNKNINLIDAGQNPENIVDKVIDLKPKKIIILDAADFSGIAGEVRLIDEKQIQEVSLSTHTIPLPVVTAIIKQDINVNISFIGIQPEAVSLGEGLSAAVKKSADEIVNVLMK